MKTQERKRARELRRQGWSVKQIERELSVSRASVSLWVRDIELGETERHRLQQSATLGRLRGAERKASIARAARAQYQREGRVLAQERDASYAAGCMLYWAEGWKSRNSVRLSNSDPALLSFFAFFLREHFDVPDDRFRVHCYLFADHLRGQRAIEQFWLDTLRLPRTCLQKSTLNTFSKYSQKKRLNKLPYGTCDLGVHSGRILQTIYGSIQEYGGFERPEWLD